MEALVLTSVWQLTWTFPHTPAKWWIMWFVLIIQPRAGQTPPSNDPSELSPWGFCSDQGRSWAPREPNYHRIGSTDFLSSCSLRGARVTQAPSRLYATTGTTCPFKRTRLLKLPVEAGHPFQGSSPLTRGRRIRTSPLMTRSNETHLPFGL